MTWLVEEQKLVLSNIQKCIFDDDCHFLAMGKIR